MDQVCLVGQKNFPISTSPQIKKFATQKLFFIQNMTSDKAYAKTVK